MTEPSPPAGLQAVLADGLAALANASLDLDPASRARLAALEGYRVQVVAAAPPPLGDQHFGLSVTAGKLRVHARAVERPNVIVRGAPLDLVAWLLAGEGASGSRLVIDGDGTVLQELTAVLRAFRPDLGAPLERLLGPDIAGRALGGVELALAALRSAFEAAGSTVHRRAVGTFVDRAQMERYLDDLDALRLRVDRLAARVQFEEQRRGSRGAGGRP
jgi:ubiquinone biosynthesis accessory factor UbiJ